MTSKDLVELYFQHLVQTRKAQRMSVFDILCDFASRQWLKFEIEDYELEKQRKDFEKSVGADSQYMKEDRDE